MRLFTYVLSIVVAGILIASPVGVFGQKKYTLSGIVRDSATKKPIVKAVVVIAGTKYEDSTKTTGSYKIDNLIPGTNNLLVWANGYDSSIIKFEIRKDMQLDVLLVQQPPSSPPVKSALDTSVTVKKDSVVKIMPPPAPAKTKKIKKTGVTDKEKEQMRLLIEDAIFSKSIYFAKFKEKKRSVTVEGSFSIDTGYLYEFEAKFAKKADGFELSWFNFEMKGRYAQ
jgi:hypothetical protein